MVFVEEMDVEAANGSSIIDSSFAVNIVGGIKVGLLGFCAGELLRCSNLWTNGLDS